jgi:hypothetical protein
VGGLRTAARSAGPPRAAAVLPATSPPLPATSRPLAATLALLLLGSLAGLPRPLAAQPEPPRPQEPPRAPEVRVWRTGGLKVETAGLLLSGQQGGDLPIAVLATPLPGESGGAGSARVGLGIEVSGPALLAGAAARQAATAPAAPAKPPAAPNQAARLRLDFVVYALGAAGEVQGSIADTVELDLSRLAPRLREGGVAFSAELRLPPGEHSLRVLVRQPEAGAMGLRSVPLTLPSAADGSPRLLIPLFPQPAAEEAAWVEARAAGPSPAEPSLSGAARPVLELDQECTFTLPALHLAAGEPALRIELLAAGAVVADLAGRLEPRSGAYDGVERLAASFVPRGAAPGAYELRAVVVAPQQGAAGGQLRLRSPALPVVIARRAAGQVWARIEQATPARGEAAAGAGPAGMPARRSGRPGGPGRHWRGEAGPLLASFRQALAGFAAGQADAARDAVAALERKLLRDRQATPEDLANLESDALDPVAAANPEALIPVLRLYELLYLNAADTKAYDLATHAREMFFALTEAYLKRSRAEGARRLTARLLTVFGGGLEHQGGAEAAAERAFRRAAALDPKYETARLCLAVLAERHGDYRAEISLLEPLIRDHPDRGEARLRLALAWERSGETRAARRLLEELLRSAAADWTLPVGYEELAKLLLANHQAAAAESIVREAMGRFPGDEKLGLMLGLVLDAEGNRGAAREAADAIGAVRGQGDAAAAEPRHRYTQLPNELLLRDAEGAATGIGERLASLAAALRAGRAGGG